MPLLPSQATRRSIGNVVAPARFIAFAVLLVLVGGGSIWFVGWRLGFMIGFDVASATFLLSCYGLLDDAPSDMRANAKRNEANRPALLALTFVMGLLILTIVASELMEKGSAGDGTVALIVLTLVLAWIFSNTVYTIHYAICIIQIQKTKRMLLDRIFPRRQSRSICISFIFHSALE